MVKRLQSLQIIGTDGWLVSLRVCICAQMGPTMASRILCVCFNVNDEYLWACTCVGVEKKSEHFISISGVMLGVSGPWGHLTSLFINLLPDWKDPCCSPSPQNPHFYLVLCHISVFWLLFFNSFAAFPPVLGWTLGDVNESHVLCDFPSSLEVQ